MVYFIQQGSNGPVKIGYTQDAKRLQRRLVSLQCGNPERLYVRAILENAGPASEERIHRTFGRHRLRGEWFTCHKGLRRLMADAYNDPQLAAFTWCREYEAIRARMRRQYGRGDDRFAHIESVELERYG